MEISCHLAALDVSQFEGVVRLREGHHRSLIDHETKSFRVYVEWCPGGDLNDFIWRHRENKQSIPEPMLWYAFECLAECAKALEDGDMDDGRRVPGWQSIVHR